MSTGKNLSEDFELDLIVEYYSSLERQGPGSPEVTQKALGFIDNLTEKSRIADIGCGTGVHTLTMARHTPGRITAIDMFPQFIDVLNATAVKLDLQQRVQGIVGNMESLDFQPEELDLIWSEGAIYNIGFERGLNEWKKFLKVGGYLAASEISWFTEERPTEITDFWMSEYPEIDTVSNKVAQMQKAGYIPVATFVLPENSWTEHYYPPQHIVQKSLLEKYAGNKMVEDFIKSQQHEEDLYNRYKSYYGYVFYVGKKIG